MRKYIPFLIVIIALHLAVLSRLKFAPYPELFIYPYLKNIGLLPYSQIFDQHFPGIMFLPINLGTLGIMTPSSMRLIYFSIVAVTQVMIFTYVCKFTGKPKTALVASFIYLVWQPYLEGSVLWIDNFMPLFLLPSAYHFHQFFESAKIKDGILSGLALGLALIFKQVVLPLILVLGVVLLIRKGMASAFSFMIPALIPLAMLFVYIIKLGIWSDFYFWTVKFNMDTFALMGRKHATVGQLVRVGVIFTPVLLAINKKKAWVPLLYMSGAMVFAYARFDFVHLQPALPFAAILLALAVGGLRKNLQRHFVISYICLASLFLAPYLKSNTSQEVLFFSQEEEELTRIIQSKANKDDSIFILGAIPHLYALSNTRPAGNIFVFQFPWFMVEAEDQVLRGIVSDPPVVVLRDESATTGGQNLMSYMPKINEYVNKNYKIDSRLGTIDILVPK